MMSDNTCSVCKVYYLKDGIIDAYHVCNCCNWNIDWKRTNCGKPADETKCIGTLRSICDNYECKKCFKRSFISSDKAIYWNYALNNGVRPRDLGLSSTSNCWFDCNKCLHSFNPILGNVTKGSWCPYCSVPCKKLCNEKCVLCFNRSFASSEKAKYWSKKNIENPRDVILSSRSRFWFDCSECKHSFEANCNDVTSGYWCGYCCTNGKLCDEKECVWCFNKSFASSERVKSWSKKNKCKPRQVSISSSKKFWFDCLECKHAFQKHLFDVTKGSWCAMCKNKTEAKLKSFLLTLSQFKITHQAKFDWCCSLETGRRYPFDFLLRRREEETKREINGIVIELDGPQHFRQVSNWESPEHTLDRDLYKSKLALENSYSIIRICQTDVFSDTIDWKNN